MSCSTSPTTTKYSQTTLESTYVSYSQSVSSLSTIVTTTETCATSYSGSLAFSSCSEVASTLQDGGASTVQVPFTLTTTYASSVPVSTGYTTICSTSDVQSSGSSTTTTRTDSSASQSSPSTSSASTSPSSQSSATQDSTPSSDSAQTSTYITQVDVTSTATLSGGSVVTSTFSSTKTVVTTLGATTTSGATKTSSNDATSSSSAAPGAIIGAIVGGIIALFILAFILARCLRGRKRASDEDDEVDTIYRKLVRRREKPQIDLDAEHRPYTEGTPLGRSSRHSITPSLAGIHIPPPLLSMHMLNSDVNKPLPRPRSEVPSRPPSAVPLLAPRRNDSDQSTSGQPSPVIAPGPLHVMNRTTLDNYRMQSPSPPPASFRQGSPSLTQGRLIHKQSQGQLQTANQGPSFLQSQTRSRSALSTSSTWSSQGGRAALPPGAGWPSRMSAQAQAGVSGHMGIPMQPMHMSMPSPPHHTDAQFVHDVGAARGGPSSSAYSPEPAPGSGRMDKRAEAEAERRAGPAAEPPPPAYSE